MRAGIDECAVSCEGNIERNEEHIGPGGAQVDIEAVSRPRLRLQRSESFARRSRRELIVRRKQFSFSQGA